MLYSIMNSIRSIYRNADAAVQTIIRFAIAAAFLNLFGSLSDALALLSLAANILILPWVMYCRVCAQRGIPLQANIGRLLLRGALCSIGSIIPGILLTAITIDLSPAFQVPADFAVGFVYTLLIGLIFNALISGMATGRASSNT